MKRCGTGGNFRLCAGMDTSAALSTDNNKKLEKSSLKTKKREESKEDMEKEKDKCNYSFTIHSYHLSPTSTTITSLSRAALPSSTVFTSKFIQF
jgi:hypothetical protein